ncbi:hypothetical protein FB45DRAFT_1026139 [Roridomyces roridus]|uniref:Uncharacterized protein n=1 Tax=Roridomyces roridus TaxID=1738132 RepID=A0AAD7FSC7_9AGAR|nr:hypothetical protein FB45DRAFT_1026139 [Roridomyces roridus]
MGLADAAALRPESLVWSVQTKRFNVGPDDPEEEEGAPSSERRKSMKRKMPLPDVAKEYNPVIVAFYAQVLLAAGSFQSTLYYFLLPFDHCEEDPMISLCITVALLGCAAQRQSRGCQRPKF